MTTWEIVKMKLEELRPYRGNPREIAKDALVGLEESVKRFGYVEPIIWNKRTKHIVGGHQRFEVLRKNGVEEASVVVVDMPQEDELAANITLNNPEVEGEWDSTAGDLIASVERETPDLFKSLRIDGLRDKLEGAKPRRAEDSYKDKNKEITDTDLTGKDDMECPCCGFKWEVDENDVVLSEAE